MGVAYCTFLWFVARINKQAAACTCNEMALVGSVFSTISPLLEKCAATATHRWLAQGLANASDTRVERLLLLFPNKSCPIIHTIVRSFVIFRTRFEQFSSVVAFKRAGWTSCFRYLIHWYQATVCSNRHRFNSFRCVTIASDYSCWPNIDHLLYACYARLLAFSTYHVARVFYTWKQQNMLAPASYTPCMHAHQPLIKYLRFLITHSSTPECGRTDPSDVKPMHQALFLRIRSAQLHPQKLNSLSDDHNWGPGDQASAKLL